MDPANQAGADLFLVGIVSVIRAADAGAGGKSRPCSESCAGARLIVKALESHDAFA
jgi:hypothetical protein